MKRIKDMDETELIQEIMNYQHQMLMAFNRNELKVHVIDLRIKQYHRELHEQADLDKNEQQTGLWPFQ